MSDSKIHWGQALFLTVMVVAIAAASAIAWSANSDMRKTMNAEISAEAYEELSILVYRSCQHEMMMCLMRARSADGVLNPKFCECAAETFLQQTVAAGPITRKALDPIRERLIGNMDEVRRQQVKARILLGGKSEINAAEAP